jgi:beta-phosphoglucomutase-like phosphatase (HAD superfamily)
MKSHAIDKYGVNRGGIICGNIIIMRKKMYNQIGSVKCAPNRFKLKEFGGDMTIEEFRENQTRDQGEFKSVETSPVVNNLIPIISNTKKMDEIKNATTSNNALKLKRTKPLKRNHNNLESALGLIITPKT